ncbi:MAG: hypothetical protein M1831_004589 [Alyxoria varia]|nr:MAG: hypothetical protein M1831_004589 [Alyxoria varia]
MAMYGSMALVLKLLNLALRTEEIVRGRKMKLEKKKKTTSGGGAGIPFQFAQPSSYRFVHGLRHWKAGRKLLSAAEVVMDTFLEDIRNSKVVQVE